MEVSTAKKSDLAFFMKRKDVVAVLVGGVGRGGIVTDV